MSNQHITITGYHPTRFYLYLSDHGTNTRVEPRGNVVWHMAENSGVTITGIEPKAGDCTDYFSTCPHKERKIWTGKIKRDAEPGTEWYYTIYWTDQHEHPHEEDPKIAIKPPDFHFKIIKILLMVVGAFTFYKIFSGKKKGKH
ncbi:MAG: hypothetical protein ABI691_24235 [Ginsengibacter sp.]